MENMYGQMLAIMKGNGFKIKLLERVSLFMLMGMFMKETGKMIWLTARVYINIAEVQNMKGNGKMTYKMVMVSRPGQEFQILLNMKDNI